MKHIFIIGSKGIPAQYGGFETFVDKLTQNKVSNDLTYHVACMGNDNSEFEYNNAKCFNVKVPNVGAAKAVLYDILAIRYCVEYIKKNNIENAIVYVLACRIGPFIGFYKKQLRKLGAHLYVNPDGHEWMRAKWNMLIRKYWKYSEKGMVKHADLLICDSINIEKYIKREYNRYNPKTCYIAYGADVEKSNLTVSDAIVRKWYQEKGIEEKKYFLIVGRFVPENNYETMLREFIKSNTCKDLVIITNVEQNKFYEELKVKTNFDKDKRIKFVGTVYDSELLAYIRENAYAYFHGHEVGGTNPSLLEALATTNLNLLLDVGFNKEVAKRGALYWNKEAGNLQKLIDKVDDLDQEKISYLSQQAKQRIHEAFSWSYIVEKYENLFSKNV